jgi:hypothetical protein
MYNGTIPLGEASKVRATELENGEETKDEHRSTRIAARMRFDEGDGKN